VTLLEEDFALLLDFAELLEAMLLLDFTELLLDFALLLDSFLLEEDWRSPLEAGMTEEEDFAVTLDFGVTLEEDFALDEEFDFTELLLASSQSSQTLDEESSPGRTKLLSSSSQAASASVNARANTRRTDPRLREDDSRNVVTT
jgi:hypothetical protein